MADSHTPGRRRAAVRFFGIYRGTVTNNLDPEQRGRVLVLCPDVSGEATTWAMPCVPLAGPQMGVFVVPPVGAGVWLQFEAGSPDSPVWMGGFWADAAQVPALAAAALAGSGIVLQSLGQNALVLSDAAGPTGGILLKSPGGASIAVNDAGITLENGKGASIVMQGPTVAINGDALEIT